MRGILIRTIPLIFAAVLIFAASGTASAQTPFYIASPQELAGPPGSIIRQEPMPISPLGALAYRVLYRSTGLHGEPIAVSGVVIVPLGFPLDGGRQVVAWAHPTSGVVPHCAPSLAVFLYQQIQGLREMILRGYVVVATDYPGLGTPGPHPYLVGISEGRAVLDSVRAARSMPEAQIRTSRFAVWGHSQGGQAALFTGLLAKSYAPELDLAGVAAAAPATELIALMDDDFKTSGGKNLTAMTLWSWSRVFGAPISRVVEPDAIRSIDGLAEVCIESVFDISIRQKIERPLESSFLSVKNIANVEPWRALAASNTPGPLARNIPVFIAQGTNDELVRPEVTEDYFRKLCRTGSRVRMMVMPGVNHGFAGMHAASAAVAWITDRFAGVTPPNDCGG